MKSGRERKLAIIICIAHMNGVCFPRNWGSDMKLSESCPLATSGWQRLNHRKGSGLKDSTQYSPR